MSLVPDSKVGKISFYETRVGPWGERAAEIGTTPEQVAQLADFTAEAREALIAQVTAQQAAQTATARLKAALATMMTAGSQIIQQVRARAAVEGESIYQLALIPTPAKPSPISELGTPGGFAVELQPVGSLALTWKCKHPDGAVGTCYHIERAIPSSGPMVYLGTTGEKKFVDETIPAGTESILYQVRAVRSTKVGPEATQMVRLCSSGRRVGGWMMKPKRALIAA